MKKKFILFLIICFCLFVFANFGLAREKQCPANTNLVDGKCVRALEITYPKIGDEPLEEIVAEEGLPGYVRYIFTLSVTIIGFVIFGVLIYNGILYLTAAGNPGQVTESKKGILYAFGGGLLLLSSFLIFYTINPQLTIMRLPEINPLEQVVVPGIYICNYDIKKGITVTIDGKKITINDISPIMTEYTTERGEKQIEAAKKLRAIMNVNNRNVQVCEKLNASTNLGRLSVTRGKTIFQVPFISITPDGKRLLEYRFGIVLHELENFRGQCSYYPKEDNKNLIYRQIENFSAHDLPFNIARSVTLFRKPDIEPVGEPGVSLFSHFNYNRDAVSPPVIVAWRFLPEVGDIEKREPAGLFGLANNARSISFLPAGSYLALLFRENNFGERCTLIHKNNPNLIDILPTTGDCAKGLFGWVRNIFTIGNCTPQLGSMIVIKGVVQ